MTDAAALPANAGASLLLGDARGEVSVLEIIDRSISYLTTQYREASFFQRMIKVYLRALAEAGLKASVIPLFFDLDDAVGDQLTLIGKRMGWPRCHPVCVAQPVYGVVCAGVPSVFPIAGLCEDATFINCGSVGAGELCITDDTTFRNQIRARRYQALGLYDVTSLTACVKTIWGGSASIVDRGDGTIVLSPGRTLTARELLELPIAVRCLPIAPGIKAFINLASGPLSGIGQGWGGLCDDSVLMCPVDPHAYDCP